MIAIRERARRDWAEATQVERVVAVLLEDVSTPLELVERALELVEVIDVDLAAYALGQRVAQRLRAMLAFSDSTSYDGRGEPSARTSPASKRSPAKLTFHW